jgi:hypothetical protein
MDEVWKDIKGYEGIYKISNYGCVLSFSNGKCKPLKCQPDKRGGYLCVILCKNSKKKLFKIHRLVAEYFCEGYKEGLVVNHIDGNRQNNIYTNLEWCTQKDNIRHAADVLKKTWGGPIGSDHPKSKRIAQYSLDGRFITAYGCIREMSRETGYDSSSVCKTLKGKSKQAYGFVWKYL